MEIFSRYAYDSRTTLFRVRAFDSLEFRRFCQIEKPNHKHENNIFRIELAAWLRLAVGTQEIGGLVACLKTPASLLAPSRLDSLTTTYFGLVRNGLGCTAPFTQSPNLSEPLSKLLVPPFNKHYRSLLHNPIYNTPLRSLDYTSSLEHPSQSSVGARELDRPRYFAICQQSSGHAV